MLIVLFVHLMTNKITNTNTHHKTLWTTYLELSKTTNTSYDTHRATTYTEHLQVVKNWNWVFKEVENEVTEMSWLKSNRRCQFSCIKSIRSFTTCHQTINNWSSNVWSVATVLMVLRCTTQKPRDYHVCHLYGGHPDCMYKHVQICVHVCGGLCQQILSLTN